MMTSTLPENLEPRRRAVSLTTLSLSYFMVLLDSTVVNVALPAIEKDLHGSVASIQWVVSSYTLVFAGFLLSGGTVGDRYGVQRTFRLGLALFTGASLLCGLAPRLEVLIFARALQGLGAALMVPGSLSLIAHLYTDPHERVQAVALWAGIGSIAFGSGPTLGGLLIALLGWRGVFLVNMPFGLLALLLAMRSLPSVPLREERGLDVSGQVLAIVACCALISGLIEWGQIASSLLVALFLLAILCGAAFLVVEARTGSPLLPLRLFRSWCVSATMLVALIYQFSFFSVIFVFSLFFQQYDGFSALKTGLALLPQTAVGSAMVLFATGPLARWLRPRTSLAAGMFLGAIGMLIILVGLHVGFALIVLGEVILSMVGTFVAAPMTAAVLASVEKEYSGVASACLNAARQMGGVLGVAILGTLLGTQALFIGTQEALVVMMSAFLLGCALILSTAPQK